MLRLGKVGSHRAAPLTYGEPPSSVDWPLFCEPFSLPSGCFAPLKWSHLWGCSFSRGDPTSLRFGRVKVDSGDVG